MLMRAVGSHELCVNHGMLGKAKGQGHVGMAVASVAGTHFPTFP